VTARHDNVVRLLAHLFRTAGGIVHIEPRSFNADRVRPDLEVIMSDRMVFLDVAVAHAAAPSRRSTAPLAAARAIENTKRAKYGHLAARQGAVFLAFAVDLRSLRAQAEQVIRLINSQSARFSFGPRGARDRALPAQLLAVAIQKGNALIARYGALAARSAARR